MMNELRKTPNPIIKYNFRLPMKFTEHIKIKLARLMIKLVIVADSSGPNGLSYALKICNWYGRIAVAPVKIVKKVNDKIIKTGFNAFLRFNSTKFSQKVGNGCTHFISCFKQD